ncbi:MAG: hypothetical protein H6918_09755 [Sphingomonadaceae bacterium]|nr:hypothetical protein [Sphingomonadaceae bacterium]
MMNSGDIPFVVAALAGAAIVAAFALFTAKKFGASSNLAKLIGTFTFPLLLMALYVALWDYDPHGIALIAFMLLALLSLPVTFLTSIVVLRRLA